MFKIYCAYFLSTCIKPKPKQNNQPPQKNNQTKKPWTPEKLNQPTKKQHKPEGRTETNKGDRCIQRASPSLSIIGIREALTGIFLSLSVSQIKLPWSVFMSQLKTSTRSLLLAQFRSEPLYLNSMSECFSLFLHMAQFQERLMHWNVTCKEFWCADL